MWLFPDDFAAKVALFLRDVLFRLKIQTFVADSKLMTFEMLLSLT